MTELEQQGQEQQVSEQPAQEAATDTSEQRQQQQSASRQQQESIPYQRFAQQTARLRGVESQYESAQQQIKQLQAELEAAKKSASTPQQKADIDGILDELDEAKTPAETAALRKELNELRQQFGNLSQSHERAETIRLEQFYAAAIPSAAKQFGLKEAELVETLKAQPQTSPYWDDPWQLAQDLAAGKQKISHDFIKAAPIDDLIPLLQARGYTLSQAQAIADQQQGAAGTKTKADVAAQFPKSGGSTSGKVPEAQSKTYDRSTQAGRLAEISDYLRAKRLAQK